MIPSQRLATGRVLLTDYNFTAPDTAMITERAGVAPYADGDIESYDYPGGYLDQGTGKDIAHMRVDKKRGQDPRHRATGDCATLRAGMLVKVTGGKVPGVDKSLCLSAHHKYSSDGYGSDGANSETSYEGQYLLMPAATPLRPERKTPLAIVQGPQTAKVVGEFLEGDPDKPLVTGCVYNGKNDVPYPLPKTKHASHSKRTPTKEPALTSSGLRMSKVKKKSSSTAKRIATPRLRTTNQSELTSTRSKVSATTRPAKLATTCCKSLMANCLCASVLGIGAPSHRQIPPLCPKACQRSPSLMAR